LVFYNWDFSFVRYIPADPILIWETSEVPHTTFKMYFHVPPAEVELHDANVTVRYFWDKVDRRVLLTDVFITR
jgi:hypothetical protein